MTRLARALCSLHGAVLLWLAYCAVQSARNHAVWATCLFAAASCVTVIAVVRELELADQQIAAALAAEGKARAGAKPYDTAAGVARVALADACCETWWTSLEAEHDDTCPKNDHRSAA